MDGYDIFRRERRHLTNDDLKGGNLENADLEYTDLEDACLKGANLKEANLKDANLRGADLRGADLRGVNLNCANLCEADLRDTVIRDANLEGADLKGANLECARLEGANLKDADLRGANLECAHLEGANLEGADLEGANLYETFFISNGVNNKYRTGKVLTAPIIGYKKCSSNPNDDNATSRIVILEIPRGAIVFSINGHKYRTNVVKVVDIEGNGRAFSLRNGMSYYVGDIITVYNFNCQYNVECSNGIHFFLNKDDAINYYY